MNWSFLTGAIFAGVLLIGSAMLAPRYNAWAKRWNDNHPKRK